MKLTDGICDKESSVEEGTQQCLLNTYSITIFYVGEIRKCVVHVIGQFFLFIPLLITKWYELCHNCNSINP